ncbi:MAG: ABC transporter permease [Bacteroidota bacterium]
MKNLFTRNRIISLVVAVLLLIIWEILSLSFGSDQILPGPDDTLLTLFRMLGTPEFYTALGLTLLRGVIGFAIAFIAALLIGIPAGLNSGIDAAFRPVLVTIRSTPVIAIILLALIWFRVDQVPVFIGFLTMLPILTNNISQGIRNTEPEYIQMAQLYSVRKSRILREIYFPSILPWLFTGISTAVGFGWRSVIIGEVLSQPRYGIGSMMQDAQSFLLVSEVIAWTLVAVVVGALFEWLIRKSEQSILRWKP